MEIRVLGPLTVAEPGTANPRSLGPAQRRLLAALCVNAGHVVASERLADMLGLKSSGPVRTTVHRLRNVIGDVIEHQPPGYVVPVERLDSHRFQALLSQARAADVAAAIDLYDRALSLWHGSAYVEFSAEEWALAESARLDELHTTARAERLDALLASGRISDATADAEQLIRDQPLRERPRALLMQALTSQGRQTEALRAYQDYRTYLADEAGVEPTAALVELEGQILSGEFVGGRPTSMPAVQPRAEQPIGTVTFLLSDVQESAVRSHVEDTGGWIFTFAGLGLCAAFGSATTAVEAAISVQKSVSAPGRIAVATGEAEVGGGTYTGAVVEQASHVIAACHRGQILVDEITGLMVDGIELVALGNHRPADSAEVMSLLQVQAEGLRAQFPPPISQSHRHGNLAAPSHELIGRRTEIEALSSLLQTQRLVTLTGSGGVGKTSLSLHVANAISVDFPDGVWWVELASVREPSAVAEALAGVLGVVPDPAMTIADSIARAVEGRRLLVVLDNCEHVLDEIASLANTLLGSSQQIAILATSREHLRIAGERVWSVPPLDCSEPDSAAVQLFVQRSQALVAEVDLDADREAILQVCKHLDGIAFAIELAAARMVSMRPSEIRDRLDDRFRLLTGPRRGLEHQQTLLQTVQWSYDLLSNAEQQLLCGLSVFVDGFDLDAARHVAASGEDDEFVVMDLVESLVRKSLLTTERASGRVRYRMLETIRGFAADQLQASNDAAAIALRHARYFSELGERYWLMWNGPEQPRSLEWAETEFANLRAGFRAAVEGRDLEIASSIAANTALLVRLLQMYEPVIWVEEILVEALEADVARAQRLKAAVGGAALVGRAADAIRYASMPVSSDETTGMSDELTAAWVAFNTALSYRYDGQHDEWLARCTELAEGVGLGRALGFIGLVLETRPEDDLDEVRALGDEAVGLSRALEHPYLIAYSQAVYGRSIARWDAREGLARLRDARDIASKSRLLYWTVSISREIAALEAVHGQIDEALRHYAVVVDSFQSIAESTLAGRTLAPIAATFKKMGDLETAATLYGCYTRHRAAMPAHLPDGLELPVIPDEHGVLRAAAMTGSEMDLSQAMRYAQAAIQQALLITSVDRPAN